MGIAVIIPNVDFSSHGLGKVTLTQTIPLVSMSIAGETTVLGKSATYRVQLYPGNTSQRSVTWSVISGGSYATINSDGVVTILSNARSSAVTIKATSVDNSEIYATLNLTLTYRGDTYGEDLTDGLTWTNGYYAQNYSITSSTVTKHSNAVAVNADDILLVRIMGRGFRPIIECGSDLSNKLYGLFVGSLEIIDSNTVYNYAYHVSGNGYVSFCSKQGAGVEFWRAEKIGDITPTWLTGYIDISGNVQSSSVTQHSAPIPVSAGDIIVVKTAGNGFSLVSLTNQSGTSYTPILIQQGGTESSTSGNFCAKEVESIRQPYTPVVGTDNAYYQGVVYTTNTPVAYPVYIAEDGYISVCGKTSLEVVISKYKAGQA